jgi:hypothetical protein
MYPSSEYIWSSGTGLPDCPSGVGELDFRIVHPEYNGLSIRSSGTGLPDCPSGVQELGFRIVHPEYSISYYTGRGETLHGLPDLVHLELHFRNQLMDTLDISLLLPFRLDPFIIAHPLNQVLGIIAYSLNHVLGLSGSSSAGVNCPALGFLVLLLD